jgi:hypothetical protein
VPTPAAAEHAAGAATPVSAVRAFATAYVNWTAATVTADLRALARASVGQARSAMELEAGETAQDGELQRGALANHGTVEAVAPERGSRTAYVVVTRESTSAAAGGAYSGLKPAWHVTVATVARQPSGRWVLSGWQPEG